MSKELKLSKGLVAIVDDEDYEELNKFKWSIRPAGKTIYGYRGSSKFEQQELGYPKTIHLHRQILNVILNNNMVVDHINCNGLINTKDNLRLCNKADNIRRSTYELKSRKSTSKYRGVHFNKQRNKFIATISNKRKNKYLGCFDTEEEAAIKYNEAALKIGGKYANLNIINNK